MTFHDETKWVLQDDGIMMREHDLVHSRVRRQSQLECTAQHLLAPAMLSLG